MKAKGFIVMIMVLFVFSVHCASAEEKPVPVTGIEVKEGPCLQLINLSSATRTYVLYQLDHELFGGVVPLCTGEIKINESKKVRDNCKSGAYMLMIHPGLFQAGKSYRTLFKITDLTENIVISFEEGGGKEGVFSEMNI